MEELYNQTNAELVNELAESGSFKTPLIRKAFEAVDRKDFVPPEYIDECYENYPLPIGQGQTISQPYTVAFMLELLQPAPGHTILDIGSGSGWQTGLLAHTVGKTGKVVAVEVIPELYELGKTNLEKYNFVQSGIVECVNKNAQNGMPESAPFDRIIAAAAADEVPKAWKEQLAVGGRIVVPVKDSIKLIIKKTENDFEEHDYPGFLFVPFVKS